MTPKMIKKNPIQLLKIYMVGLVFRKSTTATATPTHGTERKG